MGLRQGIRGVSLPLGPGKRARRLGLSPRNRKPSTPQKTRTSPAPLYTGLGETLFSFFDRLLVQTVRWYTGYFSIAYTVPVLYHYLTLCPLALEQNQKRFSPSPVYRGGPKSKPLWTRLSGFRNQGFMLPFAKLRNCPHAGYLAPDPFLLVNSP